MQPTPQPRSTLNRNLTIALILVTAILVTAIVALATRGKEGTPRGSGPSATPTNPAPSGSGGGSLPTPIPSPTVPAFTPSGEPTRQEAALLADRVGFGGKVTGGTGGKLVEVSTSADSGAGSLRAALAGNDARWIVFTKDLTISLQTPLAVGSNKTIDGRGHRVEITGPGVDGLDIDGSSNVIVESLVLTDFGDTAQTKNNDPNDAVHLDHARGVWIDHNDLSKAGDKLIAVSNGSSGVTVTGNYFHDQEQTFQIGNQATGPADTVQTVTVADNFFDHTGYRNPVVSYGRAHVYNNYFLDWKTYAVRSERAAQLYLQNNVFVAVRNDRAAIVKPGGDGCNDAGSRCDSRLGSLKIAGNLLLGGAKIANNFVNGTVFAPGDLYRYTAQPATSELAKTVAREAGPRQ